MLFLVKDEDRLEKIKTFNQNLDNFSSKASDRKIVVFLGARMVSTTVQLFGA